MLSLSLTPLTSFGRSFCRREELRRSKSVKALRLCTEKKGFVTATKLGTTDKIFVAATKNFAAAIKRFVDRTKHFVVATK